MCYKASLMTYIILKFVHMIAAITTISGFLLRGYWMLAESSWLEHRLVRTLPHVVDTIFLVSGIAMLWMLSMNPFLQGWLIAKFVGLLAYILLGTIALKRGATKQVRTIAFVAAVSVFAYIAGVALSKSPASWLAWLTA